MGPGTWAAASHSDAPFAPVCARAAEKMLLALPAKDRTAWQTQHSASQSEIRLAGTQSSAI